MKTLLGYFWRGSLVLVPVAVTAYFAYFVIATFDKLVPVGIPGLGFVLAVLLITLVGFLTSNVIGRAAVESAERWLSSLPLLKLVYGSIRDLVQAFVGDKKRFDKPVALALAPGSQIRVLGFVTREALKELDRADHVAVYVPQSYNFAGNLLIAPRDQVERLDASSSDLMTFIVSGGVSGFGVDPGGISQPPPKSPIVRTALGLGPHKQK
ncbi:MAG TPA: DUF502 domain-containing protein [Polyangiaceae bacterium]|nr:DUF502 domain-containing protein [Polyangiaceae bacterium]